MDNNKIIVFLKWFKLGVMSWITLSHGSRPRRFLKQKAISLKNYIVSRPTLRCKIMKLLNYFPILKYKLKEIGMPSVENIQISTKNLSPKAQKIYEALILKQKRGF